MLPTSVTYMITTHSRSVLSLAVKMDLRVTMRGVSDLPKPDNPRIRPVVHKLAGQLDDLWSAAEKQGGAATMEEMVSRYKIEAT